MRLMRFCFTISHVPGKDLVIADALSRAPLAKPTTTDESFQSEVDAYLNTIIETLPASEKQIENILRHQKGDEICQQLISYCTSTWPNKADIPGPVKAYYPVATELTVVNGLLMRGNRIVIPLALQVEILDKLHAGHQGITKCRERARQSVWWPGLSKQLEELVKTCKKCCKFQLQHVQPLMSTTLPLLPWQQVAMDIFEWEKKQYLLAVDYYSRYIEIARLNHLRATEVILHAKSMFARHGIPEKVITDNGPQFSSTEFCQFSNTYEFEHTTSSPYFPQSNGEAERAVKTIKSLLRKAEDPYLALLAYRTTPLEIGYSPSQLLMSRRLRSTVPMVRSLREPQVPDKLSVSDKDSQVKCRQKQNYDDRHRVQDTEPLSIGDPVWLPDQEAEGQVVATSTPRSYIVETPRGQYRRNRAHVNPLPHPDNITGRFQQENSSTDSIPPIDELSNEETCSLHDESSVVTRTRSGRVVKPPRRFDPDEN